MRHDSHLRSRKRLEASGFQLTSASSGHLERCLYDEEGIFFNTIDSAPGGAAFNTEAGQWQDLHCLESRTFLRESKDGVYIHY